MTSGSNINNLKVFINNKDSRACSPLIDCKHVFAKVESSLLSKDRVILKSTELRY
jgi:hypothetical protein